MVITPPRWKWYQSASRALLAIVCLRLGIAYSPLSSSENPPIQPAWFRIITSFFPDRTANWDPIWVFGIIWLIIALAAVCSIFWPRLHNAAFLAAVGGSLYFAFAYIAAQFDQPRNGVYWFAAGSYLITAGWLSLQGLMTREQEQERETEPAHG